jgi:hypothetical protein
MQNRGPDKNERGQITLMIGMLSLTLFFLITFVINTGLLVSAKINLQNAADLAAYAGAATQARQLNHIAFLNYEMRREYKKFLFRYYVLGGMAYDYNGFLPGSKRAPGDARSWQTMDPSGIITNPPNYNVPVVCFRFNVGDNYCRVGDVAHIANTNPFPGDPISDALSQGLTRINKAKLQNCSIIGLTNEYVLQHWLYKADPFSQNSIDDPGFAQLKAAAPTELETLRKIVEQTKPITEGMGLIPALIWHKLRIDALSDFVNAEPKSVTKDTLDPTDPKYERTAQAFRTAYQSLGRFVFPDENVGRITLTELLPSGPERLLKLHKITTGFDAYALVFNADGTLPDKDKDCIATLKAITTPSDLTVGVYSDALQINGKPAPGTDGREVYYAIKLEAKAHLMFPFLKQPTLRAYAAAKPYGGRIGPYLMSEDWRRPTNIPRPIPNTCIWPTSRCENHIPNLAVLTSDSAQAGKGWDSYLAQIPIASQMLSGSGSNVIGSGDLARAMTIAMAPHRAEEGKYSIPTDFGPATGGDRYIRFFSDTAALGVYRFFAPLASNAIRATDSGAQNAVKDKLINIIASLVPARNPSGSGNILPLNWQQLLLGELETYYSALVTTPRPGTPLNESYEIAQIRDPLALPGGAPILPGPKQWQPLVNNILLVDPSNKSPLEVQKIRSGYVPKKYASSNPNDFDDTASGRVGYSVKFVAFDYLRGLPNKIEGGDLNLIQH